MLTIIQHDACRQHDMGLMHPECPDRVKVIWEAILSSGLEYEVLEAANVKRSDLELIHTADYLDLVFAHGADKSFIIDPDTMLMDHTLAAAMRAAGANTQAVDLIMSGNTNKVFCNVRPPGHHAEVESGMGFCFFSNVALGAKYALAKYDISKVAIIDFDVHHGNGTQSIVEKDERILFCSSYQHPFYPNRFNNENSHVLHIKLLADSSSATFRELVAEKWLEPLQLLQPEILFFSAGFDAHQEDPLANLNFTNEDYAWITRETITAAFTNTTNKPKVISSLEGGYNLEVLGEAVVAHLREL